MKYISIIIAALALAACGQAPADKTAEAADATAPAFAVATSPVQDTAPESMNITKADMQAMLDAARADTAKQIADAQVKMLADKAEAEAKKAAAAEKAATEKRIARAERAAAQAKAKAAEPIYADVPRRVCTQETVTVQVEVPDAVKPAERNALGMLLGAGAGALVGNQVGGGNGKTLATIAAAAGGAYAGDSMANSGAQAKPGTHFENRTTQTEVCRDVVDRIRVR